MGGGSSTEDELAAGVSRLRLGGKGKKKKKRASRAKKWRKGDPPLAELSLDALADALAEGRARKVIVMVGAGMSVSAGIPDFRTPGTGLYDNLAKYDLPEPEDIFCLEYFAERPEAFCTLAKELFPGNHAPTPSHRFLKKLADRGLLLRCFTQNIDGLEFEAGVPEDLVVQAHGGFQAAHCSGCKREHPIEFCRERIMADEVPRCECGAAVKPDIVFFGEGLPDRYHSLAAADFPECDLLLVVGTSLKVQPFASLIHSVPDSTPRVLINREKVGMSAGVFAALFGGSSKGFEFDDEDNRRDLFLPGDCDDTIAALERSLEWEDEAEAAEAAPAAAGGGEEKKEEEEAA